MNNAAQLVTQQVTQRVTQRFLEAFGYQHFIRNYGKYLFLAVERKTNFGAHAPLPPKQFLKDG